MSLYHKINLTRSKIYVEIFIIIYAWLRHHLQATTYTQFSGEYHYTDVKLQVHCHVSQIMLSSITRR